MPIAIIVTLTISALFFQHGDIYWGVIFAGGFFILLKRLEA